MPVGNHLILDFVLLENFCNRNCQYCKLDRESFDPSDRSLQIHGRRVPFDDLFGSSYEEIQRLQDAYDVPILVLSGGEVSQFPGFLDFARTVAPRFEVIQILSNGQGGPEWVRQACVTIPALQMKFSLDGHTVALNKCRNFTSTYMSQISSCIAMCVAHKVPVEVNCVVTSANIEGLADFVQWMRRFEYERMQIHFLPVRGRPSLRPGTEAVNGAVDSLLATAPGTPPLAPAAHLETLRTFYKCGRDHTRCLLPFVLVAGYDHGEVGCCTLVRSPRLPRIGGSGVNAYVKEARSSLDSILQRSADHCNAFQSCYDCFLDYHIVHSALEGTISPEELFAVPLYSSVGTPERFFSAVRAFKALGGGAE